jgi:hypothetical protein
MKKRVACLALLGTLIGCTTTAVEPGREHPIPAERVFLPNLLAPSAERSAQIVVTRDQGVKGSACAYLLFLDNAKVVSIRSSESATLHVTPGGHFLRLETTGGFCGSSATSQNVVIGAGERQAYRAIQPASGEAHLSRSE